MRRRDLLQAAGMTALAAVTPGCAMHRRVSAAAPAPLPHREPVHLAVPHLSWERIIRTTVGLRPHRDSGFVLKAEKFDAKTVIHDYGFGGAGMSLAWGCGDMVSRMALEHGDRRAAVLGCGSPGLTAARQLQRHGFEVSIYTMTVPPDTTSNKSMAGFTPTTALIANERRTPQWDAQFREAAALSYVQLQLLAGKRGYGVYWIDSYNATDDANAQPSGGNSEADLLPDELRTGRDRVVLGPGEHPFPAKYAVKTSALAIEPSIYLDALVRDFLMFGGRIAIRKFDTPRDLMSLSEPIVVNCTGLGSKTLFNDQELTPIKGQITFAVPQPEVTYRASHRPADGSAAASINPRSDGIGIGNVMQRDVATMEPDLDVRQKNVDAAIRFFGAMRNPASRT